MRNGENRRLLSGFITVALSIVEVMGHLPAYAADQEEEYSIENTVISSWEGGYQGELLLRNLSDREMTEWSIDFTSPNSISDYWGASFQLADTVDNEAAEDYNQEYHYTVEAVDYTGTIAPGEAITIGYIASGTADDSVELSVNYVLVDPDMTEGNPANTENNSSNDENADGQQNPEQTAEPAGGIYVGDGYTVEVQIPQTWDQAYNAKLLITNTTGETLHNWGFLLDTTDEISGLYNAVELSEHDGTHLFKNAGYNQDIPAGGTVEVGYTAFYEESPDVPNAFALASFEKSVEQTDYSIELFVTDEWDGGATAEIVIENTSDQAIEDWEMEFDTDTVIHNVWDGVIVSHEGPHYVVRNADYAQNIGAGGCWTVGLQISGSVSDIENIKMSRIVVTDETEEIELDDTKDTDEDGIPDVYEELFGTNPEKKDTDGDDLNDYIEIFITGTDPTKYDSVITGVSDSDIDSDGDGVSNGDEINLGLDPQNEDSDYDLMSDGDEINVYHTDPAKRDTDGDTLLDGEEIKIGLDPLNPATFGVPDAEYVIEQTIESDSKTLQMINDKETAYQLSLEVRAAGYAGNMEVEESGYSHVLENESVIGMIPSFYYENKLEEMTISFHIADAYIGNELGTYAAYNSEFSGIKRLSIAYFSEELQVCLPIASQYDEENHVVYATVTKQGTYCLVDMEKWLDMVGFEPADFAIDETVVTGDVGGSELCVYGELNNTVYDKYYYGGHLYSLIQIGMTWDAAEEYCENVGGHLVTIGDTAEQKFIEEKLLGLSTFSKYWIGGYTKDALDQFEWITGEPLNYINWRHGEPNFTYEKYIHIYDSTDHDYFGLWNNEVSTGQYYFICEWDSAENEEPLMFFAVTLNPVPDDFGPITSDNVADYDGDGVPNNQEIKFSFDSGSSLGTSNSMLELYSYFEVTTGMRCFLPLGNNSERVMSKLQDVYLVMINSDPTLADSDGDLDLDGLDPKPLYTQLNGYFISMVEVLENAAQEYDMNLDGLDYKYSTNIESWLVMMFIRRFNIDYRSNKWAAVGGVIDYSFVDYVKENYYEVYKYFDETVEIYANYNGDKVDLRHFSATFCSYTYNTDFLDSTYLVGSYDTMDGVKEFLGAGMFEYHLNNLGGWAGDLQTMMRDAINIAGDDCDYDTFYETLEFVFGNELLSFPWDDMYADTDSYNIFRMLQWGKRKTLTDALTYYYSSEYLERYTLFTNRWSKMMIRDCIEPYCDTNFVLLRDRVEFTWPLFSETLSDGTEKIYIFSEDQSQATVDMFSDFLMDRIAEEK